MALTLGAILRDAGIDLEDALVIRRAVDHAGFRSSLLSVLAKRCTESSIGTADATSRRTYPQQGSRHAGTPCALGNRSAARGCRSWSGRRTGCIVRKDVRRVI